MYEKLNWPGFSVGIESDLFLCGGSKLTVGGLKLTSFKCDDWLGFCVGGGGGNWLVFLHAGRKSLGFSVSIETKLFFVRVVDIDLISVRGIELDLI